MAESEVILKKLLPKIAKEQHFVNYDLKIEPISSGGANYTSTLFNITMSEGGNVLHMFAKVAVMGGKMRTHAAKIYKTESFVYTKLMKIYQKLEDTHQVPQEHRLIFAKFYGYNPDDCEETIVLENLVMEGYQAYDRFTAFNWEYGKSAFRELAKMHALALAYNNYYPEEFNSVLQDLKLNFDMESDDMKKFFGSIVKKAVKATRELNKEKLERYFGENPSFPKIYNNVGKRPVLAHGDYRPSNLLHRVHDDGTIDIKILDLQTIQGSSPVVDLLYFIFTGSDEEFRAQYYDKLIDHYYTELTAAMKRLHLDPEKVYSREDFDFELKEKLPFGLTIAVFTLPIITVDAEDAPVVNEDMDLSKFSVEKTNDLYTQRLNGVVNDYVKWGILK